MHESVQLHPAFQRSLSGGETGIAPDVRPLGHPAIDRTLEGGLARARLHEIFAIEEGNEATALGLAAMLALRIGDTDSPWLWLREEAVHAREPLYGPGLAEIGVDPGRLILGVLPDMTALLRAGAEALRCPAVGILILEIRGRSPKLDLTASRRLALAAEAGGVTPLVLRIGAHPVPSAAHTRWGVRAAVSNALDANAPGFPMIEMTLLRRRGGPAGMNWTVEWDRDAGCFREPALSGAGLPLPGGGSLAATG